MAQAQETRQAARLVKPRSGLWLHGLIITLLLGFSGLLLGGFWIYRSAAPVPAGIVDPQGRVLATAASVKGGQAVYQKYGLMDYGSVLGHGAYLGPDFTADSVHIVTLAAQDWQARRDYGKPFAELAPAQQAAVAEAVRQELRANRYDATTGTLPLTDAQVAGLEAVRAHYRELFTQGDPARALPPGLVSEAHMPAEGRAWVAPGDQLTQMSDFFFWTAWLASTNRPGLSYSYTNNWPYDPAIGNTATFSAVSWSAVSVALLVLLTAGILFVRQRWHLDMQETGRFPRISLSAIPPTVSQRKTAKYFVVVAGLFLVQTLLGALLAHYYVDGRTFYGLDVLSILPFSLARSWHLQLAIFWVATAWLAMGLYVAPLVGGREPKRQGLLVDVLFGALVLVVVGSLAGEWLGAKGFLGNLWFLLGHQGWEYLELGRIWQVLLAVGLGLWLVLLYRGLRPALKGESDKGGLTHLLLYSAVAIPFMYGFAFIMNPSTHITMADYWRWWIIHLWVEGMFEVFAVVVIGFLMVRLGLVSAASTLRALYFQLIVLLGSGIIGTGHHYYFIGSPEVWIALGAVFSALEVIPLTFLIVEAYGQYRAIKRGGEAFPYRSAFWFMVSTAVWNLVGAGVLGFLINLPIVNYFEHGSFLTAAHGHAALAGVYGMLGVSLLLFSLRNVISPEWWDDRLAKLSVWGLNLGLAGMLVATLLPVGFAQLGRSYEAGFWSARSLEFYQQPAMQALLWIRVVPDSVFIVVGVLPLVYLTVRGLLHLRPAARTAPDGAIPSPEEWVAAGE